MRLGIIIPFRNREEHLKISAPVLKNIGRVFVIEQAGSKSFNRAKLINTGYLAFNREFDYFAAHDVDMIPEEANYEHSEFPCHLATMAEQFGYTMPYPDYFGGVTLFPKDKFEMVNGFSNNFWGWGGEDDEIRRRFIEMAIPLQSRQCRFRSLPHLREINQLERTGNARRLHEPIDWDDGLSSCQYEITSKEVKKNYTLLRVNL
jgi:hypothetical protein